MKAATLNELKKELNGLEPKQLVDLCLRVAKFKKENKELVTYLLFEAENEETYIENVKEQIREQFSNLYKGQLYQTYKGLRKILRLANKYIKYSGLKQTEVELLIFYCNQLKESGIKYRHSNAIMNLYEQQVKKIEKAVATLHEDLQYDYGVEIMRLQL